MLDGNDLLRIVVHSLVHRAKASGTELLEDGILACRIVVRRHRDGRRGRRLGIVLYFMIMGGLGRGRRRTSEDAGLQEKKGDWVSDVRPVRN